MKMSSDMNKFIFDRVYKIILRFQDEYEIILDQISEWNFDFDKNDKARIDFINVIVNKEIFDRFCIDDNIIFLHIEGKGMDMLAEKDNVVMIDVPCNMYIRKVKMNGGFDSVTDMYVHLEGTVE